jgi:hypothetical protein
MVGDVALARAKARPRVVDAFVHNIGASHALIFSRTCEESQS